MGNSEVMSQVGLRLFGPKSAPKGLVVMGLLPGMAEVGSRVEPPSCGGAFGSAGVPLYRNGGRQFLRMVPSSTGREDGGGLDIAKLGPACAERTRRSNPPRDIREAPILSCSSGAMPYLASEGRCILQT